MTTLWIARGCAAHQWSPDDRGGGWFAGRSARTGAQADRPRPVLGPSRGYPDGP